MIIMEFLLPDEKTFTINLFKVSKFLAFDGDRMWFLVDPKSPIEERKFWVLEVGKDTVGPKMTYLAHFVDGYAKPWFLFWDRYGP